MTSEGQEGVGREEVKRLVGLEGFHVFHSHTNVAADSDHLDLVSFVDVFEDLVDDASNLCFENSRCFACDVLKRSTCSSMRNDPSR